MSVKKRKKNKAKFKQKPSLEHRVIRQVNKHLKQGIAPSENTPLDVIIKDCKTFLKEVLEYHYPLVVLTDFIEKKAIIADEFKYDVVGNTLEISRIATRLSVVDRIEDDLAHIEVLDIAENLKDIAQSTVDAFEHADAIYPQFIFLLNTLAEDHSKTVGKPVTVDEVITIYASGWISELLIEKTQVEVVDDK